MTNHSRPLALLAAIGLLVAAALGSTMTANAQPVHPQPAPAPPVVTPNTDSCPFGTAPPPAVDASEVPQPGQTVPPPIPRPASPVGGTTLGQCGLVTAAGTPPVPEGISAASWVVADLDSGRVLAAKDPHGLYRPASTLKLFTASLALDKLPLDEVITGTQADSDAEGSSVGVGPGGRYTVRDLLLGLLLESGNDAAHALSARMGGDAATVQAMNALAASLGASDTRAVSPSGLDGPGMSTSSYDLALIFRHDIANPTFAALTAQRTTLFPGYANKPPFLIANQDKLLDTYPGAIGGKNGFTNDARQTYVGAAARGGRRLVVTLMAGERIPLTPDKQATVLLDYGFALPANAGVGDLVNPTPSPSPASTNSAAPAGAGVSAASASPSGDTHRWTSTRSYWLLGIVLVALLCAWGATRRARRRRQ
ncbi:MAG: D-alanyl-D-alanine carboxypeptidase family protein [Mycobacteriaceae bacterium]